MERIQREDDEAEARFVAHVVDDDDDDDDGIVVDFPSLLIEEDEFFMTMPE